MSSVNMKKIHHLGFVVNDLDETLKAREKLFGVKATIKENPDLQVRLGAIELCGIRFVFNESTHPESRWARYLEENGQGLEHIAFEVEDIEEASQAAVEAGLAMRFEVHKPIHGLLTNFVEDLQPTDVEFMGPEK